MGRFDCDVSSPGRVCTNAVWIVWVLLMRVLVAAACGVCNCGKWGSLLTAIVKKWKPLSLHACHKIRQHQQQQQLQLQPKTSQANCMRFVAAVAGSRGPGKRNTLASASASASASAARNWVTNYFRAKCNRPPVAAARCRSQSPSRSRQLTMRCEATSRICQLGCLVFFFRFSSYLSFFLCCLFCFWAFGSFTDRQPAASCGQKVQALEFLLSLALQHGSSWKDGGKRMEGREGVHWTGFKFQVTKSKCMPMSMSWLACNWMHWRISLRLVYR